MAPPSRAFLVELFFRKQCVRFHKKSGEARVEVSRVVVPNMLLLFQKLLRFFFKFVLVKTISSSSSISRGCTFTCRMTTVAASRWCMCKWKTCTLSHLSVGKSIIFSLFFEKVRATITTPHSYPPTRCCSFLSTQWWFWSQRRLSNLMPQEAMAVNPIRELHLSRERHIVDGYDVGWFKVMLQPSLFLQVDL
jgi:hypothetical protein